VPSAAIARFLLCDWQHKNTSKLGNMTVFDVLNLYQTPFEWMLNSGIHIEDVSYVGLYKEYIRMKKEGYKMTYIVVFLAEKYRISERKVYTLIKRLSNTCEPLDR
jgi:hypothetical protein